MGSLRSQPSTPPGLNITGLAGKYPSFHLSPESLESFAKQCYDVDTPANTGTSNFRKLFAINRTSGISSRPSILLSDSPFLLRTPPPTTADLDALFRGDAVDLAAQACTAALHEAGVAPAEITHAVAVTCTNAGNPGYDALVAQAIGLVPGAERALLHGVGCAGGLTALRVAAHAAGGAARRGRAARVLVFAVEACTANARCSLGEVAVAAELSNVAPVLFSDAAAALVLCHELAVGAAERAVFELQDWRCETLPGTSGEMRFLTDPLGFRTILSKDVPRLTSQAIIPLFEKLKPEYPQKQGVAEWQPDSFDWALHPGGKAILHAAQTELGITEGHLRASLDIYKTCGNSSSPTVLIVLDRLRKMGQGRKDVVACSFGPGLVIAMAILKRCR